MENLMRYLKTQTEKKGVSIGNAWKNRVGGFGISLTGKVRDPKTKELKDVRAIFLTMQIGEETTQLQLGNYDQSGAWQPSPAKFLATPRINKREGKKDSDFILYCYPKEE